MAARGAAHPPQPGRPGPANNDWFHWSGLVQDTLLTAAAAVTVVAVVAVVAVVPVGKIAHEAAPSSTRPPQ